MRHWNAGPCFTQENKWLETLDSQSLMKLMKKLSRVWQGGSCVYLRASFQRTRHKWRCSVDVSIGFWHPSSKQWEEDILCPSLPIFLTHQENPSGSLDRTARNAHSPQIESEYGCIDWLTLKNRWNSWLSSPTSVSSPREITVSDQSSQSAGHTSGLPKLHEMPNDGPNAFVPYQP